MAAPFAPGESAPNFTGKDSQGASHRLEDCRGKFAVLEWFNHQCRYVRKHYDTGTMQGLQKKYTGQGVRWFSVDSTTPGSPGYRSGADAEKRSAENGASPTAVLLDPQGVIGRLYKITVTPQVVVIDPQGRIIYYGAIDDAPSYDPGDIEDAMNYVALFLDAALAGKEVQDSEPYNPPYGCPVEYTQ